ncbi:putative periplasmic binding protein-like I [Helianthus debilis subsp. tardiflorus]
MENTYHHMLLLIFFIAVMCLIWVANSKPEREVNIGVILDMDTGIGKMSSTCITIAIHDFYQKHNHSTTIIRPHFRDSKQDNVRAASVAIDLLKNVQVAAILGPTTSSQADFVIAIGNKSNVPIISPATSPSLSTNDNLYFVRSAHASNSQLEPLAALIKHFKWREVVFVYEDDEYGRGLVPYFSNIMQNVSTKVMCQIDVPPLASDDWILKELYKLKTMQTRVFVVHALPDLASRFFNKVNEAGMMEEGYVWIITEVLTSRLHLLDRVNLDSMHGVLGVKSYIPRSKELTDFEKRWKREFWDRNPKDDETELDMLGIWWYDTVYGLAMALEKAGNDINTTFRQKREPQTDLDAIGTSEMGSSLIPWIRNLTFKGLSGDFCIVNGQLQSSAYEVVNIIETRENPVGFWIRGNGISKKLNRQTNGLRAITWPGDSHVIPKGWEIPTNSKNVLKIGVPAKGSFVQFIDAKTDPETQQVVVTGFCVDVFNAVVSALPYAVKPEFIPFVTPDGKSPAGSYSDLIHNLSNGLYDAVVGDVTILASRWDYIDFTLPYTEGGVALIVPFVDERKNAWIFVRPIETPLWITAVAFFIYTGFVVWVLEHRVNKEFRGPPHKQVGMIFWFSFSTLVFAHSKCKLISNLSRFVVIVWVFVVLVLTSSYTASLTSMLTVEQLRPTHTDIDQIRRNGESVGYQKGSYVADILKSYGFDDTKLESYSTFEEYDRALQAGSRKGGVSAIMDELPYVRLFLAIYCNNYTMTNVTYRTAGFGFVSSFYCVLFQDFISSLLVQTSRARAQ